MSITWCHEDNTSEDFALNVAPGNQKLEIVRRFQILTTTMDDSSITVCACNDLPTPFAFYSKGNDYSTDLVATTCDAKRDVKQPLLWHVEVGYTQAVQFSPGSPSSGSQDITCYLPSARNWRITEEEVIQRGRSQLPADTYLGTPAETYADAMAKDLAGITNSCNDLFVDGVRGLKNIRGWEIRRYEWVFNETQANAYTDVVNSDTCWAHDPGTVKMVAITGDWQSVNNYLVWLVSYEFHICDPGGWGVPLVDNGKRLWVKDDGTAPTTAGAATGFAAIKDKMGNPIDVPALLDGVGYFGRVSAVLEPDGTPFIVIWHYLEEATFGGISPALPSMQDLNIITV